MVKGYCGACFSGTRGHDQQKITLLTFDGFKHGADGADLIVPPGNIGIGQFIGQGFLCWRI